MKKVIVILFAIVVGFLIKIPKYVELNNLAIIEGIGVSYNGDKYTIYLKEVIPVKNDQGIDYQYEYYKGYGNDIESAYKKLEEHTKKKLYIDKCKFLVTNLKQSNDVIKILDIKPKNIYHPSGDIYEELENINS